MPTGVAFSSGEAREKSPYKHRLHGQEAAGDYRLLCLLERAGVAHTRNWRHTSLREPGLLLDFHQRQTFPGTLLGSSTELSSLRHLGLPAPLPARISVTDYFSGLSSNKVLLSAALHTGGEEGMEELWLPHPQLH